MIFADEPAFSLPPISRALKFADFDRMCVRALTCSRMVRDRINEWQDTATDPGGYHGEIELTPVGAVPVAEI